LILLRIHVTAPSGHHRTAKVVANGVCVWDILLKKLREESPFLPELVQGF
jgi:hypothetical protein